jgi:hypothetical protein
MEADDAVFLDLHGASEAGRCRQVVALVDAR